MTKIMEYMSMSCPIVSFDLAESRVSAGESAVYAHNDDEEEFAQLIAELLDAPERRAEMGATGRRRIEQSLSWSASKQQLLKAYDYVLSHRSRNEARARHLLRLVPGLVVHEDGRNDRRNRRT